MIVADTDSRLRRLKRQFKADREHSADWRKEAKEDFAFVAGDQWSEADRAKLKEQLRPIITFNRVQSVIQSVSGMEIGNRQETRFIPREAGDAKANELLTEANRWFRDNADADDEDSEAFVDAAACGMGWTETTLDFDQEEDGEPKMDAVSPLEMFWDKNARKKNLSDAKRLWRVRKMSIADAKRLFPDADEATLNAGWATIDEKDDVQDREEARRYEGDGEPGEIDDGKEVTIVHAQWFEHVDEHTVIDPRTGQRSKMDAEKFAVFQARAAQLGMPVIATKRQKRVVYQAFIGSVILEEGQALCPERFSFRCVTAYLDKVKGTFFGIVRGMKDPQRWANRWLSQALDIVNSQAKGGVMMEASAVDDARKFERDWTQTAKPTVVADGALSNANGPRIVPKPQPAVPSSFLQMMEFAISSIRDVSGVSVEMLGQRSANQAASLEYQRRQAGMQILLPLMDNLRRYRRDQGRLMLYLIQNYLSDGRLVRIIGEERTQYVPLVRQADAKYDIIVDDMPNSPNQKELIASQIAPLMPNLPPPVQMEFMAYLLPDSVGEKLKGIMAKMNEPNPVQQAGQQIQMEGAQAKVMRERAAAAKDTAQAQAIGAGASKTAAEARRTAVQAEHEGFRAKGAAIDNVMRLASIAGGPLMGAL